jgi:hypothetical protein
LLSIYIHRAYGNIPLPKTYEIIFDVMDTTRNWEVKSAVRYAFNYRDFFHTDLWRGHHSHCYVEIIGAIPPIFDELQDILIRDSKEHRGIGLCTRYDWQFIKPYLDEQNNNRQIK